MIFRIIILASIFLFCGQLPSFSQASSGGDITNPNGRYLPAGTAPPQGAIPPPGNGASAPTLSTGDKAAVPAPSGRPAANPVNGTNFPTQYMAPRSKVNLLVGDGARGTRVALTFQPDQLTSSQRSKIQGIVGGALFSTQPFQNISASAPQIEKIQNILNPPAGTVLGKLPAYTGTPDANVTGRLSTPRQSPKYISKDQPDEDYAKRHTANLVKTPRIVIRQLCNYLVKNGVVLACFQIMIAGALIVFGYQHAGNKAIAGAGGLILLLMAFSIWKIDMVNVFHADKRMPNPTFSNPANSSEPDSYNVGILGSPGNPPLTPEEQVTGSSTYVGDNTLSPDRKTNSVSRSVAPAAKLPASLIPQTNRQAGLPLLPLGAQH